MQVTVTPLWGLYKLGALYNGWGLFKRVGRYEQLPDSYEQFTDLCICLLQGGL